MGFGELYQARFADEEEIATDAAEENRHEPIDSIGTLALGRHNARRMHGVDAVKADSQKHSPAGTGHRSGDALARLRDRCAWR